MKRYFILLGFCLLGCGNVATFDKPHPINGKELRRFPQSIQGEYANVDGSILLKINPDCILKTYLLQETLHKDSAKFPFPIAHDTTVIENMTPIVVKLKGDSIHCSTTFTDTLFQICQYGILKKWKGSYYLNTLIESNSWVVTSVIDYNQMLLFGEVNGDAELDLLREVARVQSDSTTTNFHLSKEQFKAYVQKNGFGIDEVYKRIKQ